MALRRSFEDLKALLSGAKPLPESNFVTYNLPLTVPQLIELEPLIKDHPTLKGLRLRGCNIRDDGCEVLSRILAFNNTLKQLELPNNGIGNGGAMFLANALRNYNHTLCVLDLQDNPCLVDGDVMGEIADFLARNNQESTLRRVSPRSEITPYKSHYKIQEVRESTELSDLPSSVQMERRVLCLEHGLDVQSEAIEQLRELGSDLSGWRSQLDVASAQMAQVLEMLGGQLEDLRTRMDAQEAQQQRMAHQQAASPAVAAASAGGPELTTLAAQFRDKHEELQRSLDKLQQAVGPKQGVQDTHRLLVDAVELITKRVESLEKDPPTQALCATLAAVQTQVQQLGGQLSGLQGQQAALEAGAASAAQLAALQGRLEDAEGAAPRVKEAISSLESLHALVQSLAVETSSTSEAVVLTSTNVAALANSCAELQQQVSDALGSVHSVESRVETLSQETAAATAAAASAGAGVTALEQNHGEMQLEVGKLHLAVDTLEETLNSLDASARLGQQEAQLHLLHSSQEQLQVSLEKQMEAQDGRFLGLQAQLSAAQEGVEHAHGALSKLSGTVEQHPSQWRAEAEGLVAPLREKLGQQEREVQIFSETMTALEARAASGDAAVGALREEVAEQAEKWAAAVEAAAGPVQEQLAKLEAKQSEDGEMLQAARSATAALSVRLDGTEATINTLKATVNQHPALWEAALTSTVTPVQQELAQASQRLDAADKGLSAVQAHTSHALEELAELKEAVSERLPGQWRAEIGEAVGPVQQQLALVTERQGQAEQSLQDMQGSLLVLGTQLGRAEATIEATSKHPGLWRGDIAAAVKPLCLQLDATEQAVQSLRQELASHATEAGTQLAASEASLHAALGDLRASLKQQPGLWEAAVAEAAEPLRSQLAVLDEQQGAKEWRLTEVEGRTLQLTQQASAVAEAVAAVQAALDGCPWEAAVNTVAGKVEGLEKEHAASSVSLDQVSSRADLAMASVDNLKADFDTQPWQADVASAISPLAAQLAASQEQHASAASALEARVAGYEQLHASTDGAIATLRAELGEQREASEQGTAKAVGAVIERVGAAEAALCSLQGQVQGQPAQWQAAVAEAAVALKAQLTELEQQQGGTVQGLRELKGALEAGLANMDAAQVELEDIKDEHPRIWQAAIAKHTKPLEAQLAALERQHTGLDGSLQTVQAALADLTAQADAAQAALQDVQAFPHKWETSVKEASNAFRTELAELKGQQDNTLQAVQELQSSMAELATQAGGTEAATTALQKEVSSQRVQWQAAIAEVAEPLRAQLLELDEQQGISVEETGLVKAAMADLLAKVEAAQAALVELQDDHPGRRQAAVRELAEVVESRLVALEEAQANASSNLSQLSTTVAEVADKAGTTGASLTVLQEEVQGRAAQWQATVAEATKPLKSELATIAVGHKGTAQEVLKLHSAVEAALGMLNSTQAAVLVMQEEHPQQWQHAMEAAAGPLRAEVAALGEQQGTISEGLATVKDVLADVAATAGAAQAAIASLQEEHPAQWQAYVVQATVPLKAQLVSLEEKQEQGAAGAAELRESVADVLTRVGAAQAAIAAVQAKQVESQHHPGAWQAAVAEAAGPLKVQLAALVERHEASLRVLGRVQDSVAGTGAKAGRLEGRVRELEEDLQRQPSQWQAAVASAQAPLAAQLAELEKQQAGAAQTLSDLQAALEGRMRGLEEEQQQHPGLWQAAVTETALSLKEQLAELDKQQRATGQTIRGLQAEMARKMRGLEEEQQQQHDLLQATVEAALPLKEQLPVLERQQEATAHAVAGMHAALDSTVAAAAGAQARVSALSEEVAGQLGKMEGIVQQAVSPIRQQLAAMRTLAAASAGAVSGLEQKLSGTAKKTAEMVAAMGHLKEALDSQPAKWDAVMQHKVAPLSSKLGTLEQQQADTALSLQATHGSVDVLGSQQEALAQEVAAAQAKLSEAASSGSLVALQKQVEDIAASLAALPQPFDDSGLAGRVTAVEGALGILRADLDSVQAAVDSATKAAAAAEQQARVPNPALVDQLGQLQEQVDSLQQAVGTVQASVAAQEGAAAEKEGAANSQREAEATAVAQLTAAVGRLGEGQSALESMLEGLGQEQLDLASRLESLPALLLGGDAEGASLPSPSPLVPQLSLRSLHHQQQLAWQAESEAHRQLESHPLLTSRTWYEDSSSDLEGEEVPEHEAGYSVRLCGGSGVDHGTAQAAAAARQQSQQQQELLELRASLAVHSKQSCHLQATVADQAAKIGRLESQLAEMRLLVTTLAATSGAGQARGLATTPKSATLPFMRRSLASRLGNASPLSTTTLRSAYYDACSEAGDDASSDEEVLSFSAMPPAGVPAPAALSPQVLPHSQTELPQQERQRCNDINGEQPVGTSDGEPSTARALPVSSAKLTSSAAPWLVPVGTPSEDCGAQQASPSEASSGTSFSGMAGRSGAPHAARAVPASYLGARLELASSATADGMAGLGGAPMSPLHSGLVHLDGSAALSLLPRPRSGLGLTDITNSAVRNGGGSSARGPTGLAQANKKGGGRPQQEQPAAAPRAMRPAAH